MSSLLYSSLHVVVKIEHNTYTSDLFHQRVVYNIFKKIFNQIYRLTRKRLFIKYFIIYFFIYSSLYSFHIISLHKSEQYTFYMGAFFRILVVWLFFYFLLLLLLFLYTEILSFKFFFIICIYATNLDSKPCFFRYLYFFLFF